MYRRANYHHYPVPELKYNFFFGKISEVPIKVIGTMGLPDSAATKLLPLNSPIFASLNKRLQQRITYSPLLSTSNNTLSTPTTPPLCVLESNVNQFLSYYIVTKQHLLLSMSKMVYNLAMGNIYRK